jgi:hypothetical protein
LCEIDHKETLMGTYEDKLNEVLSQGDWDAPNFAPVREAYAVLSETLGALAKHDAVQGDAGEAASESFKALRSKFESLEKSVGSMENVISRANSDLSTARNGTGNLPSGELPSWIHGAVDAAEVGSKVFIPAMGISVAANAAVGVFESFLGGQREAEAKAQYEALETKLVERGQELKDAAQRSQTPGKNNETPGDGNTPGKTPGGGGDGPGGYTPPSYTPPSYPNYPGNGNGDGNDTGVIRSPHWEPNPVKPPTGNPNPEPPIGYPEPPPRNPTTGGPYPPFPTDPNPHPEYPRPEIDDWPNDDSRYSVDSGDTGTIPGSGYGSGSGYGGASGSIYGNGGASQGLSAGLMGGGAAAGAAALKYTTGGGIGGAAGGAGGIGGMGGFGGAGAPGAGGLSGAAGAGARGSGGLLGSGAQSGAGGTGAGAGSGAGSAGGAGASRGGMMGMGGQGAGGNQQKDKRPGLGGHIAPKLEDDDDFVLRSKSAGAGGRDAVPDAGEMPTGE